MTDLREQARDIFHYALQASRVAPEMERRIHFRNGVMTVDGYDYRLGEYERVFLIAIGKAAESMAWKLLHLAAEDATRFEGVIAGTGQMQDWPQRLRVYRGGHPVPDQSSLAAAADILRTLHSATAHDFVIFLVSGGGSAMVEQYLWPEVSLEQIAATHRALVESGAPIAAMNVVRKHLSAVKGGRLAAAAAPAEQLTIFVSDVAEGELDALSSGSTLPDSSTIENVREVVGEYGLAARLPDTIAAILLGHELAETPKTGDAIFARSRWCVLLDSTSLETSAAARARELGWHVEIDHSCDDWNVKDAAAYLLRRVEQMRQQLARVCLLSAGEITVRVPAGASGRGGRNQHFALLCAVQIAGGSVTVLSGGSDGIDGNSSAGGAVVDGTTAARAEQLGHSVQNALEAFDSNTLLTLLGDTIVTGPTGNNLRDLRILLAP